VTHPDVAHALKGHKYGPIVFGRTIAPSRAMDQALLTVAAGMKAQVETLELLGNNIANASTTGYKRDNEFQRLFVTERAQAAFFDEDPALMPVVEGSKVDYQQGPLLPTEAALDVALMGPGFLVVGSPQAPFYTRNGHFSLAADGRLTTPEGRAVLDTEDREIILPPGARIDIGPQGMVLVDDLPVAQLAVVEFDGSPPLRKAGANFFQAATAGLARPLASGCWVGTRRLSVTPRSPRRRSGMRTSTTSRTQ
jgi:flagellar basal body rod protein FlgG